MKFTVITLFPQMIEAMAQSGLVGQAAVKGDIQIHAINPRDFTTDAHGSVDDRVFGGGDGMVMKVEPLRQAIARAREENPGGRVIVMSPQGRPWNQDMAADFAKRGEGMILVCGRYAGIDNRLTVLHADDEISIGDYVLNGGEVAACVLIESVARLRPEVLGNRVSSEKDSFVAGVLESPQFTRPREVDGLPVPAPLLSGNHALIAEFEDACSTVRTAFLRPDLLPRDLDISAELEIVYALNDLELKSLGLNRSVLNSLRKKI